MSVTRTRSVLVITAVALALASTASAQQRATNARARSLSDPQLDALKKELARDIDARAKFTQQMVDQIFSFGELGFQEVETSRYLVRVLRDSGFTVDSGYAGIPTAWVARWGSGRPVITLGSDIDGIPQASQRPAVACHVPLVPGAPGHGEGHNSGQAVNITAALAVRRILEREHLPGTIILWPGVAEELVGTKAYYVRAGLFKDVDATIFTHVSDNLRTSWGQGDGTGLVSVQYTFDGTAAHAAGRPWMGRSALDAVELMDVGWNFRREHLRPQSRSHYVIPSGGDQPNVVPPVATVWYYFRETEYPRIKALWALGDSMAQGAALMTGTRLANERVVGSAWPGHFNKPLALAMYRNIQQVGLPRWSDADQQLARAVQKEVGAKVAGLDTLLDSLRGPMADEQRRGGGSDDIGDVSWNVPTVELWFPSNVPGLPGHHWANAISMATPLAHKGATAGAKAEAMTILDIVARPALVDSAWHYFKDVQTKDMKYEPLIRPEDRPAIEMNQKTLEKYRPEMRRYYYDPAKYASYLEQLGITYPTVRAADGSCGQVVGVTP